MHKKIEKLLEGVWPSLRVRLNGLHLWASFFSIYAVFGQSAKKEILSSGTGLLCQTLNPAQDKKEKIHTFYYPLNKDPRRASSYIS